MGGRGEFYAGSGDGLGHVVAGSKVEASGCRVQGQGLRRKGAGFRFKGLGSRVQGVGTALGMSLRCAMSLIRVIGTYRVRKILLQSHTGTGNCVASTRPHGN